MTAPLPAWLASEFGVVVRGKVNLLAGFTTEDLRRVVEMVLRECMAEVDNTMVRGSDDGELSAAYACDSIKRRIGGWLAALPQGAS